MSLRSIFLSGVETCFSVFNEAVKTGTFSVVIDDGFTASSAVSDSIRCIFEEFTENDVQTLSFSELIQPTDIKGLLPFVDLINCSMTTQASIIFGTEKYTVEAFDIDPMNVIFTILLRKV
jgi:nucleotidyltransferase/DNA polymerase involved in DNA repair